MSSVVGRKSNENELEPLYFQIKGRLAALLGEQSVSDRFVAVHELVKNAYDADATKATVKFENIRTGSPVLSIKDDGHGMTLYELQNDWMVVATDTKSRDPYTKKLKRRKLGHKGVGRFAIQNLARIAEVISYPEGETTGYRLVFDWGEYDQSASRMNSVPNHLYSFPKRKEHRGVELRLTHLREQWKEEDIKRLARSLAMIIPPNISGLKFNVAIEAPEYPAYSAKLRSTLLKQAILIFRGKLDLKGNIRYILESRKGTKFQYKEELKDLTCGPVEFVMFFFYRSEKESSEYGMEMTSDELVPFQDDHPTFPA